jgi:sugar (pentulose or hexulose) kinase
VTEYFRGGGFSSQFLTVGGMPMTMSRLNLVAGLGPVLQVAEGWTVDLPAKVHEALNERTNPTWPTHWFVPRVQASGPFRDAHSVMNNWGANHGAISFALDSLALNYRLVLDEMESILGRRLDPLHIVGGGARSRLLCQLASDATGRTVETGPVEATAADSVVRPRGASVLSPKPAMSSGAPSRSRPTSRVPARRWTTPSPDRVT